MNYCSLEDAWKNSDYISDQFKNYDNPYDKKNNIENFADIKYPIGDSELNYQPPANDNYQPNHRPKNNNHHIPFNHHNNILSCDDFLDHINTCRTCRTKIRERFSSKLADRLQNVILDNKDNVLLSLIAVFILIFFNLLISIFKK
uniref:Uncharacterized protein n=1 Tax=viral metagenome TaxID=1070528 RepID=A0A6C0D9A2_9ZZZZ